MLHRTIATTLLAVTLLGSTAVAQEFLAVDASTTPATVRGFGADPADATPALANLPARYIRGMDFVDAHNGYYISTESVNDSPTGLFRLSNGVSTRIADVPAKSTAVGDLTLNRDNTGMYAVINVPGQLNTLFSVSFDGQFDEIGEVRVNLGSTRISGLALHPTTGVLYGLDNQENTLVTIDTATGQATRIGEHIGFHVVGAGAMDFTADGRLIVTSAMGKLWEVDPVTGTNAGFLGELPFTTGALAAVPEPTSFALLALGGLALLRRRSAC